VVLLAPFRVSAAVPSPVAKGRQLCYSCAVLSELVESYIGLILGHRPNSGEEF
jgi:hypothetical protein